MDLAGPTLPPTPALSSFEVSAPRRAAFALAGALALGVSTQALFWRAPVGLNFLVWMLLSVAASLVSVRPRRLTPVGLGVVVSAVLLSLAVVRFAGQWTLAIAVPTALALLAVLPAALRDEVELAAAVRLPVDALRALAPDAAIRAVRAALGLPTVALGGKHETFKQVLRGLAFGVPITSLFVVLLSADVDFGRFLVRLERRLGEGVSFTAWALITAACALVIHLLYQRPMRDPSREPVRGAYRHHEPEALPSATAGAVAVSTWLMVVGQVATVFAAFVAVNLRSLFGGDALVRAPGSLTYAKYLHAGFGQLLCASALSVCLVVVGHGLLRPRKAPRASAADPIPGGRLLVTAECALLALTAVTLASCVQRLAIYEDAYGATRLRLGVAFVLLAVLAALALTIVKALRRGWSSYGGALASLVVLLSIVASWFNADAYVARTNLDRAARGKPLDIPYLTSLSADARGVLVHPRVAVDSALERALRDAYCGDRSDRGWRALRGGGCSN